MRSNTFDLPNVERWDLQDCASCFAFVVPTLPQADAAIDEWQTEMQLRADRATNGNLCVLLATLIYRGVCHYDAGMCVRLRDYRVYAGICGVVDSLRRSEL